MRIFLVTIIMLLGVSTVPAGTAPPGTIGISIESKEINIIPAMGDLCSSLDTVDIVLSTTGLEISGINLKVATPKAREKLLIDDILPGPFIDSCKWEYFEARPAKSEQTDSLQIWQITTVAELIPDSTRPICYSPGDSATIARLIITSVFLPGSDSSQRISFYWQSCADNSISDKTGNKLFVSDLVVNPPAGAASDSTSFPTYRGIPASCINDRNPNRPVRRITFENSVLTHRLMYEEPSPVDSTEN